MTLPPLLLLLTPLLPLLLPAAHWRAALPAAWTLLPVAPLLPAAACQHVLRRLAPPRDLSRKWRLPCPCLCCRPQRSPLLTPTHLTSPLNLSAPQQPGAAAAAACSCPRLPCPAAASAECPACQQLLLKGRVQQQPVQACLLAAAAAAGAAAYWLHRPTAWVRGPAAAAAAGVLAWPCLLVLQVLLLPILQAACQLHQQTSLMPTQPAAAAAAAPARGLPA